MLLLAGAPVAAAGGDGGSGSYSGDDEYDPAAGGLPALSLNEAGGHFLRSSGMNYSGDDEYDPAAGGLPALSLNEAGGHFLRSSGMNYSGDDEYDPAAGGTPALSSSAAVKERSARSADGTIRADANPSMNVAQWYISPAGSSVSAAGWAIRADANPSMNVAQWYVPAWAGTQLLSCEAETGEC
jgi:hypothetical protein